MHEPIAVVALLVLAFGVVSRRMQRSILTPPLLFAGAGLLIGPGALGLMGVDDDALRSATHVLLELTLVVILFTDASRIDFRQLRGGWGLPARLLGIAMPLTILLGTLAAKFLLGLPLLEAAVVAAILAPTDAALGQVVVSSPRVPARIRQTLNVESGLNDGIAVPVVVGLLSCTMLGAAHGSGDEHAAPGNLAAFTAAQLLLGPLVGVAVGILGGRLIQLAERRAWSDQSVEQLAGISLALLAYAVAHLVGGNGFIAAFAAGLAVGNTTHGSCARIYEFAEGEGQLLALLAFLLFGATLLPDALDAATPVALLYAVLSLTVIRMMPTLVALLGSGLTSVTGVFLGWFGPRGLASIVFALLVLERPTVGSGDEIATVVLLTVALSTLLHGVTAAPGAVLYGRYVDRLRARAGEPCECHAAPALRVRLPFRVPGHHRGRGSETEAT